MRYLYIIILILAALAYPFSALIAMERPPEDAAQVIAPLSDTRPPAYLALQPALAHYQDIVKNGGWPSFKPGTKIEPGARDARITSIRAILKATGDLTDNADTNDERYDATLVDAIKRFQRRHGLTDDGIIGKGTQAALNTPAETRLRQIEATMARMLELHPRYGRFLLVNLPAFMLQAYEDHRQVMEMKVIVGDPKNPTPRFENDISYVSFNPPWGVPTRISVEELLPQILENPEFITQHDYAVYDLTGKIEGELDPASIDWKTVDTENFPYFLRQRPGKGNALGKIKFGLIGSNDIYLHSTSAPALFAKDNRALSHGCVRVEHPHALLHFIFQGMEHYDSAALDEIYNGDESKLMKVDPLPIYLVYWTAWADGAGVPNFRKDIYGLDN